MLPILPVILLLLFSGPANLERMAVAGRLPAAIEAVQRLDAPPSERETLASLLAASKDPELTKAIFTLLRWVEAPVAEQQTTLPPEPRFVAIEPGHAQPLRDGFSLSQRSRDGPF